jgi:hypothetical protein
MSRLQSHIQDVYRQAQLQAAPAPKVRLGSLQRDLAHDDLLQEMTAEVASAAAPNLRRRYACVATAVATADYARWFLHDLPLGMPPACAKTLILALPEEFAPILRGLVGTTPWPDVVAAMDGLDAQPCLAWRCVLPDDVEVELTVPMRLLSATVYPMGRRNLPNGWVPVLMVAGDSVAAGGFNVDAVFVARCQHKRHFLRVNTLRGDSAGDLAPSTRRLAERFGLAPWKFGRHRDSGNGRESLMATPWDDVPPAWA